MEIGSWGATRLHVQCYNHSNRAVSCPNRRVTTGAANMNVVRVRPMGTNNLPLMMLLTCSADEPSFILMPFTYARGASHSCMFTVACSYKQSATNNLPLTDIPDEPSLSNCSVNALDLFTYARGASHRFTVVRSRLCVCQYSYKPGCGIEQALCSQYGASAISYLRHYITVLANNVQINVTYTNLEFKTLFIFLACAWVLSYCDLYLP